MKILHSSIIALYCFVLSGFAQPKQITKQPPVPVFAKPVLMFDNASALIVTPPQSIANRALQLRAERGYTEEMVPMKDKKGLRRIAFMAPGNAQTNCTSYADMYFDAKDKWLSTEEFFSLDADETKPLGRLLAKCMAAVEAKGYRIGICEVGGKTSLWRISTPALTWYECEVFKKSTENHALAISMEKEPFSGPNPNIYGTAYFDSNGNLVRIQAKSKVKLTAAN